MRKFYMPNSSASFVTLSETDLSLNGLPAGGFVTKKLRLFKGLHWNGKGFNAVLFGILLCLSAFMPGNALAQVTSITLNSLSVSNICAGQSLDVTFSSFATGTNPYSVLLSDNTGSFAGNNVIGTVSLNGDVNNQILNITIPANTPGGTGYLVEVSDGAANNSSIALTIVSTSAPTGATSQTFCAIDNPKVSDLVAGGSGIQWYDAPTAGVLFSSSAPLVNGTHYYATQTASSCESLTRLDVTVTVNNPAAPSGPASQTFCAIDNRKLSDLLVTGNAIQWYDAPTGGTLLANSTSLVNGTHYYASQTVSGCESATRLDVTVTVSDPAVPTGTPTQAFCAISGQTVADLTATGNGIQWYAAATGGSALATSTALVSGTHYFASQTVSGCESTMRFDVTVTVGNPGAPTGTSPQAFCVSSAPTVANLTATGTNIQWYAGATGGTALATSASLINGNHYFASQTVAGCESATRFDVTVAVNALPAVSAPASICVGATGTLSPSTGGTWVSSNNSLATVTNAGVISGVAAGSVTFTFTDGTTGCSNTTSTVTVNALPAVSPGSSVCIGPPVNITPSSGGTWISNNTSIATITNGGVITGIANGTVTFTFTQASTGCSNTTTAFTVNPNATATNPGDKTVCNGIATGNINFTGPIGGTIYNWTNTTTSIGLGASGTGDIPSFAGVNTGTIPVTATINVIPEANGCNGTAFSFDITVNPTPTVVNPGNQTLCNAATTTAVTFSGTVAGTSFNWTNSIGSIGLGSSGSGNIGSFAASNSGATPITATINVTPSANTCNGTLVPFTITINPTPNVNPVTNQVVCNGAATTAVNFAGGVTGTVFNWTNSNPAIGLGANGTGNIGTFTATNPGVTAISATITVTPTANGCPGTPTTFTFTVNPSTSVNAVANQTICNGDASTAITFGSSVAGTTYAWTNTTTSIGLAASGNGNIPSFIVTNASPASVTATITVTPTANSCPGTPVSFTIAANPDPTATNPGNQTVCNGASTTAVNFTGPVAGTTFSWTNNTTSIGLGGSGNGNIAAFTAVNNGTAVVTATITVTPLANGCLGTPITFTITVNPTASVNPVSNQTVCNGAPVTAITFGGPVTGTVYNWTNNTPSIGLGASGTGNIASFNGINTGTTPVVATISVTPTASGCAAGAPSTFTITVNPTPTVNAVANQTLCKGSTTTLVTFSGSVGTTTYNWTNSAPTIGLGATGTGNIGSFTAANPGGAPLTGTIVVTPTVNGCPGPTTSFTITVNPTATVTITPSANQSICNGSPTVAVSFSGPVTWTNNATSIGLAATGTGNIASFTGTNITTAPVTGSITVTPSANGCTGLPIPYAITVNPTTTVNAIANQALCNGSLTTAIPISSPITGTTFTWTNSAPSIGLAATGSTSNIGAFTAVNLTGVPVVATITVTPTANACVGTPLSFTITVNPTAAVTNPGNQTICRSALATINFTGTAGATFNWTNDNTAIGLGALGSGNLSFTVLNDTSIAKVAHITVSPTANGCTGTTINFNITVNPAVAITGNTMSVQGCNKTSFTVSPVDSVNGVVPAGTTYSWTAPSLPAGLTGGAAGSGASITGNLTNSTTGGLTATYTVTPTTAGCPGTPFTVLVTVYPYPPKQTIDFFQTNVKSQQLCIGALVGGGNQNDLDVHLDPPFGSGQQPPNNYYDLNNFDWDWEYATGNATGPTVPFASSPGTTTTHYQQVLPPSPSIFSPIGDYWFRFYIAQNGCATYSDTIHLQVTSTLIANAGGPYIRCSGSSAFPLTGSSVNGTSSAAITGQWSIFSGGGSLSSTAAIPAGTVPGNNALSAVTYTPAAGFQGTAKLLLKSNPPGSGCQPSVDTAYVIVLPGGAQGSLQGCTAPANWTLTNTNGNGILDPASQIPCSANLIGSDNINPGTAGTTDYKICAGTGNFTFDWVFYAPVTPGATPVWRTADQTINIQNGTNRGSFIANRPTNLVAGDLIVVILHARDNVGSVAAPDGFSNIRKDVSGNSGTDNRGTVMTYWKVATASEPATYAFQANSMGNNDVWVAVAGRVTGADPISPIDISNGTNSGSGGVNNISVPGVTTLGGNRLLISAVSVIDDDHGVINKPAAMTTIFNGNSNTGKQITYGDYFESFPTVGATGNRAFSWTANDAAAGQIFAIKPAGIPDDSAFVLVNGVKTLISGVDGSSGSFSIPVNSNDQVGFRISTKTNTGGPGQLTFYNVKVPNDSPTVAGTASITIPTCNPGTPSNPATPQSYFVNPTASDNCGTTPGLVTGYPADGVISSVNCTNTQTRTWLYADNCGLQSRPFVQTITWTSDATPPTISTCPSPVTFCVDPTSNYTIPVLVATDGCSALTITYNITGSTTRSGTGVDASGLFNIGTSTITWTVKDACNNSSTCSSTVTIVALPSAVISGSTSICNGGTATITVTLTGIAPYSITYTNGGAPVTVNNIPGSTYTFTVSPAVTTTWSLTAMSSTTCAGGTVSGSAVITVRPLPTATISGTATICSGSSTNITIAPTGSPNWSVNYNEGAVPKTITGIATSPYTFSVTPLVTTTYTLTSVTDANCTNTITGSITITVNPKPNVVVSPSSPTVCLGGAGTLLTASGASTYSWSPATGLSATSGATVTANPLVTTIYTVTGTDVNGCVNTTTVIVTVSTPPVTTGAAVCINGTGTMSSSTVCGGGSITSGPKNAGTAVDDPSNLAPAPNVWLNPGNIAAVGAPYASQTIVGIGTTHYLKATNYGFGIPLTATIVGITITTNRQASAAGVTDQAVRVLKAGAVIGTSFAGGAAQLFPGTPGFATSTYGGPASLWGTTWTPADINNANFGAAFSSRNTVSSTVTMDVDYIQITVTYTLPATLDWFTVASGGTTIGSGSPFNPVGVAGSGLATTGTAGTTVFYAECAAAPGCRTATNFVINPLPTITTAAAAGDVCFSASAQSSSLSYGATTNTPTNYTITWNAAALAAGLVNVASTPLPAGSVNVPVAGGVVPATYTGTIIVSNANGCLSTPKTFTLTVNPGASLTLTSAAGTNNQLACLNAPIAAITYNAVGVTGAGVTGLPAGVTGVYNAGVFTISGTPTASGLFNYTITTTGGCGVATATGSVNVQAQAITLTSGNPSPTICENTPIANIVYTVSGTATSATASGLPAGVTGTLLGSVFTISGTPSGASGPFPYVVTTSGTCGAASVNGTITVLPAAVGGTVASVLACSGASGVVTLTGQTGNVLNWEMSTNGGSTWSNISNTTNSQSYTGITLPTMYRAVVGSAGCASATSVAATVSINNLWTGTTSIDWNTASNWSGNVLPSVACPDVTIPAGTPFSPVLGSGTATIRNLVIKPAAALVVTAAKMQLAGTITNGGSFDVTNGTLEFNGSTPQNIAANMFTTNTVKNITLTNATGLTLSNASGKLRITGDIAFGNVSNAIFTTGDNLVLASTVSGTSRVADVSNNLVNTNNRFSGKVTVERYYPGRRSWRLVTSPLSNTGNIFKSWQAGAPPVYVPGLGMFVTGPNPTGGTGNGLDNSQLDNYSMKGWDAVTSNYTNVGNTITQNLSTNAANAANIGYYTFVRGDRNRSPDNTIFGNSNNTTLSSTGLLQTGTQTFDYTGTPIGGFPLTGNPYASSIDFKLITKTNINPNRFYVWDQTINQLGAYVVMEDLATPGVFTPSNIGASVQRNFIQSSQAFFTETVGAGPKLIFNENNKSTNYNAALFRPVSPEIQPGMLQTTLLLLNPDNTTIVADGVLSQFNRSFSDAIDIRDALKFSNVNENLGIVRDNKLLAVERRSMLNINDTIYLRLTKTTQRKYRFEFAANQLSQDNLAGYLDDKFLHTLKPLDMGNNTSVDFEITADAGSAAADRFRIVFKPSVIYSQLEADVRNKDISVRWKINNESNIKEYEIERSTNGTNFSKATSKTATGNNGTEVSYEWLDVSPAPADYYYRIRSISNSNVVGYSNVVKVSLNKASPAMYVVPNPVTDNIIHLQMNNLPDGLYHTRLLNSLGQSVVHSYINHSAGTATETIKPKNKLVSGIYQLEVIAPGKKITMLKVIVK